MTHDESRLRPRLRPARRWRVFGLAILSLLAAAVFPTNARAQLSPGPLARAHKSLEGTTQCVQCHSLSRAPMATACLNCHKDVKALVDQKRGYHARLPQSQRLECASCHPDHAGEDFAMIAWPAGGKNRFDHRTAGWSLEGKHVEATCEDCHTAKYRTSAVAGLSKRKSGTPWIGFETTCNSCHRTDDIHEGALKGGCDQCHDAKDWAPAPKFNHDDARYALSGKHVDVKCDKCHATARLPLKRSAQGEPIPLYRPVPYAKCNDCHADPHKGRLRESCASCHETKGWAAIDKRDFNHAATRYPLSGKHQRVTCAACHGKGNERPTPTFATCAGCHADVHRGEAGRARDCAACHKVADFSPATFTVAEHAKTPYPLEGRHTSTPCAACHTTVRVSPSPAGTAAGALTATTFVRLKMPSATCTDCHADAHAAQPAVLSAKGGCSACHTVRGFAPSTTTVASHAAFRFALDGAHASAVCAACHGSERPGLPALRIATGKAKFAFAVGDTACAGCHADPHAGRYLAGGARAVLGCKGCHGTTKFRPSIVTVAEHRTLGYALEGAHLAVPCADCHRELSAPAGRGSLRLNAVALPALPFTQSRGATCTGCHAESHGAQFARRKDRGACDACHTVSRFAGAERFDHDKQTKFALAGAHAAVPCAKCHPVAAQATAGTSSAVSLPESARRQYAGVSTACESCHTAKPTGAR